MRKTLLLSAAALGLAIGAPAFAQTTMGTMNRQDVRPGHVPGVGNSEPASSHASNIDRADTHNVIAPRLPVPPTSADASPEQLLGVAQNALQRGSTGEAQEALERAETRALDRSTAPQNVNQPDQGPFIQAIARARHSLASRDIAQTERDISNAMSTSTYAQNGMSGGMDNGRMASGGMANGGMANGGMTNGGMTGAGMSGGAMGGAVGQAPAASGNSAYSGAAMAPGTNALATTGATNGNAIGATTGGPSQANGIPGTPNGISSQTGSNGGGSNGGGSNGGGSTSR